MRTGRKRQHVAIDYDRRQIRLVVFRYVRRLPVISATHTVDVPAGVDVSDAAALGRVLADAVARLGLAGAMALMSVGRAQAVLKSLTLPPTTSAQELPSMVQFQVAGELPFPADEAVVDFTYGPHWDADQVGAGTEGTTVLAAALRLPVVDAARQVCEVAGLRLLRLGLRPYANLRAVYRCVRADRQERIIFVNMTADEAEIDVMCDGALEFSRSVTVSALPAGPAAPAEPRGDAPGETLERVVAEVTRSLQGFQAVQRGAQVHGGLVAGATGLEKGVAAALTDRLGVPCQLFDPSGGFALAGGAEASAFAAALGLAVGQAGDLLPFDFLNPKRPPAPRDMRKVRLAMVAGALVLLIAGVVLARTIYLGRASAEVGELTRQTDDLKSRNDGLRKLGERIAAVEKWQGARVNWLDQLSHLSNTLPGADRLYLDSVHCAGTRIVLVGWAKDRESIAEFAQQTMTMSGYEVRPGTTTAGNDPAGLGYNLKFDLEVLIGAKAEPVVATTRPVGRPADDAALSGQYRPGAPGQRGQPGATRPSGSRRGR